MAYESQALRDARIDLGAVFSAVLKRLPRIIAVTLLLLVAAYVVLMFVPRMYESSAGILVEPRSAVPDAMGGAPSVSITGLAPGVVSSQIELIKSRKTLLNVVDQLDLRSVPEFNGSGAGLSPLGIVSRFLGRKAAPANVDETVLANLLDRMTVVQARDSAIITVRVRSTNPDLAASIANAVANAHVARRANLSLSDTAEASGWLGDEIAKLRVSVTNAETAVANFKIQNDIFTGANNTSLVGQNLSNIASQITEAEQRKSVALSRASLIRGLLERGASIDGVADVRASTVIQQLTQQKAQLRAELAQKSATLLPSHPTILALVAQINELDNQINIEGRRVADGLESEAEIEAKLETSLRADLARAKDSASAITTSTVTLEGLEREAKAKRDLLENYLQRYSQANSRTDANSALPDVRVVSLAAASVSPASPKTKLILLAVGITSLVGQIGLIVLGELMSGRAIIQMRPATHEDELAPRAQDELESVPFSEAELEPDQRWDEAVEPDGEVDEALAIATDHVDDAPDLAAFATFSRAADFDEAGQFDDVSDESPIEALDSSASDEPELQALAADEDGDADLDTRLDFDATPEPDLAPTAQVPRHRATTLPTAFADLSADMALGRTRLVVLAGHRSNMECALLAEALVAEALEKGLSVALVDAGSAKPSNDAGLSDLSTENASFGDVVHKSSDSSFAEVPWGQGASIDSRSDRPLTLIEALSDIYEVVVLMTGRVGVQSTLPLFVGLEGRLVLVASDNDDFDAVEAMREHLAETGFGHADIVTTPELVAA